MDFINWIAVLVIALKLVNDIKRAQEPVLCPQEIEIR